MTKKYTIEIIDNGDDTSTVRRTNDGFNAYELMGIMEEAQLDIMQQLHGESEKAEVIKRTIIDD